MHSNIILLLSLATSAAADIDIMPHIRRDLGIILPRQTSTSGECVAAILEFTASAPTPPPELLRETLKNPQTDPCKINVPESLSDEYASYTKKLKSWYSGYQDEMSSLASKCPAVASYSADVPVCSSGGSGGSGSSSGGGGSKSGGGDGNSAVQQTGMAGVALAVAGFIVALL